MISLYWWSKHAEEHFAQWWSAVNERVELMKRLTEFRPQILLLTLALIGFVPLAHDFGFTSSYGEDAFHGIMLDSMARMDRDMRNAPMTGDPDHDFAAMMIPHHQGAIDMSKAELLYGKDPVLRRLAQEIITTQNSEIQVMRRQLAMPQQRRQSETGQHSAH